MDAVFTILVVDDDENARFFLERSLRHVLPESVPLTAMTASTPHIPDAAGSHSLPLDIAVFGAGIAGLTTAHELAQLGHRVALYESTPRVGGFFRSERQAATGMPTEYSWHGFGPWYNNFFDLLRQIPFDAQGSVYDRALSRPIEFGIFPEGGNAGFYRGPFSIPRMFGWRNLESLRWTWLMAKTWTAKRRSIQHYARLNAAESWRRRLTEVSNLRWRSCFGPWIGSDWTRVSLHTAGQFFCKQLTSRSVHEHSADHEGAGWQHGAGAGWLLLRGPSSEYWFDPWVRHLRQAGVILRCGDGLHQFESANGFIACARLQSGASVHADRYVLATNPFSSAILLKRTPALEGKAPLDRFGPLIQDGPHVQVSFRVAFAEPIHFPRRRTAVILADSEFNLTLFAQEQAWAPEVNLGAGVKSLWTGTSCAATVPGRTHNLPVIRCSKQQFIEEVTVQLYTCSSLDAMVRAANNGRSLREFAIAEIEVWHEWQFSAEGIHGSQPKWVNTTRTQAFQPPQATAVPNLVLAGAHTQTQADVWSVEAAVESGRRAAQAIDLRVPVLPQRVPGWLNGLRSLDDFVFRLRLPHILDLMFILLIVGLAFTLCLTI